MKIHVLDVDSRERQPSHTPNDYIITLENSIYDVSKVSLISARLKNSQLLINATNKTFYANNAIVTLTEKSYSNAFVLATDLQMSLAPPVSNITSVVYDSNTNALTFSNVGTSNNFVMDFSNTVSPFDVLGFSANVVESVNGTLTSGAVNLVGPDAFVIALSSGSQAFNKTVYSGSPFYTARIPLLGDTTTTYSIKDGPINHEFYSGPLETLTSLRVQFFYMTNKGLVPYDFRNANHVLRFEITCSTDKNETLPKIERDEELPPPINIPEFEYVDRWVDYKVYGTIAVIILLGVFIITITRPSASRHT